MTPRRILIIDSDAAFAAASAAYLVDAGYHCDHVDDIQLIAEHLRANDYLAIVASTRVLGIESLALVARTDPLGRLVPVVLLMDGHTANMVARVLSLPIVACLPYAATVSEVKARLDEAVALTEIHENIRTGLNHTLVALETLKGMNRRIDPAAYWRSLHIRERLHRQGSNQAAGSLPPPAATDSGDDDWLALVSHIHQLENLLRDSVEVLRKTKSAFKSKDLGALRERLEHALQRPAFGPHDAPTEPQRASGSFSAQGSSSDEPTISRHAQ